ncbi:hypothetical protein D3C85_1089640 [compost metagenome]
MIVAVQEQRDMKVPACFDSILGADNVAGNRLGLLLGITVSFRLNHFGKIAIEELNQRLTVGACLSPVMCWGKAFDEHAIDSNHQKARVTIELRIGVTSNAAQVAAHLVLMRFHCLAKSWLARSRAQCR